MDKKEEGINYVGFWVRLLAAIIDWIILGIIGRILFGSEATQINNMGADVNFSGWRTIVPFLYIIIFWVWFSATPGKLILGMKIIKTSGEKIDLKVSLIRFFSYIPSAFILFIGFIWIGIDKKKQGWHDKIAKTYVIKK